MNKNVLFTLLAIISLSLSAQINFEEGYYIDVNNNRKNVLIKNIEWLNNPKSFEYIENSSEPKTLDISDVKEFGFKDGVVFSRHKVRIDRSSNNVNSLTDFKEPNFVEEIVFLKHIIKGKASLYFFSGYGVKLYFYSIDQQDIKPLVYKRYFNGYGQVVTNAAFMQELKNNMKCISDSYSFKKLKYRSKSLTNVFKSYNTCENSESYEYDLISKASQKENKVKLWLKAGARRHKLSYIIDDKVVDFENKIEAQFGLEGEFIFKFNRNKWSGLLGLDYFSYKDKISQQIVNDDRFISIDYSGIEISLGARHSFFINEHSRFFLSGYYVVPFNLNQEITRGTSVLLDNFETLTSFAVGLGYEWKYLSLELRYLSPRSLDRKIKADSQYSNISLILGFNILN